jgi:dGTP triphosphohydrolase
MKFLKEVLKKLRWRLLVKVLEKQDELSIKVEDSTNLTLAKLQETASAAAEKTQASITKAGAEMRSSVEQTTGSAAEKTLASIKSTQAEMRQIAAAVLDKTQASIRKSHAEIWSTIEKTAAETAKRQDAAALEMEEILTSIASITKTQAEIQASIEEAIQRTAGTAVEKTLASLVKTQAEIRQTVEATVAKAQAELKAEVKAFLTVDAKKAEPVLLKAERGLQNYLRLLKGLCKRYMIIIAVRDTTGACLTDEVAAGIKALGLSVDLSFEKGLNKQHHHTYIGVIDRGQVICDALSKQKESSYFTMARDGVSYEAVSKSFPEGNIAVIKVNGVDYATNRRGLNIVVFDPITKVVVDSVCFDTHVIAFTCSRLEEIVENK